MKTIIRLITLSLVVIFSVSFLIAQSSTRDVVYLKNGSIIKGTILEMVMDQTIKIQTADGSIFVYNMSEVDRITKEAIPGGDQAPMANTGSAQKGAAFSIFGGAAIPSGDFAKEESGGAKTGFTVGAQVVSSGAIGWIVNGSYSQNKVELPSSYSSMGLTGETGN